MDSGDSKDLLRVMVETRAKHVREGFDDVYCRTLSHIVSEARSRRVSVREVPRAYGFGDEGVDGLYAHAEHLAGLLDSAEDVSPSLAVALCRELQVMLSSRHPPP